MPSARRRKGKATRHDDEPLGPFPVPSALPSPSRRSTSTAPGPSARSGAGVEQRAPARRWPLGGAAPEPSAPPPPPPRPVLPAPVAHPAAPRRRPAGATARGPQLFAVPTKGGRGKPRIYFELYWQDARQMARSYGPTSSKKPITSGLADVAMVPFYGFTMPEGFPLRRVRRARGLPGVPPAQGGARQAAGRRPVRRGGQRPRSSSTTAGSACCSRAATRSALREGDMTCFVYVAPPPQRTFVNPLRGKPWFFIFLFLAFCGPTVWSILSVHRGRSWPTSTPGT